MIFRAARDFLLKHREDYAAAYSGFEWPKLDRFNWALDNFRQDSACAVADGGSGKRAGEESGGV